MADITATLNLTAVKDGVTVTHAKTVEGTIVGTAVWATSVDVDLSEATTTWPTELGTPQVLMFELTTTDGEVLVKWETGKTAARLTPAVPVAILQPPASQTTVILDAETAADQKVKITAAGA